MEVLKVSSRSSPNSVAGALAGVIRQHGIAHIQVIGAGALNQAVKAIAIARGYVAPSGIELVCIPTFADVEIDGEARTAIRLSVENRDPTVDVTTITHEIDLNRVERETTGAGSPPPPPRTYTGAG